MNAIVDRAIRLFTVAYSPNPANREFLNAAQSQERDGLTVTVAVPDVAAGRAIFGVPVARHGVQPVWVDVVNRTERPYRLQCVALDPDYFSPLEAAAVCHYSGAKRLVGYGAFVWIFLPVLLLVVSKLISVVRANRRMDAVFRDLAFRLRPVPAGHSQAGFVYATRTEGTKSIHVRLLGADGPKEFEFAIPQTGLRADYHRVTALPTPAGEYPDLTALELKKYLSTAPATTSDKRGLRTGDPVNLVIAGEFETVLGVFGGRWDETEVISLQSCWRTAKAFLMGAEYRYSPVSALFLFGRGQDFALQRVRESINERLHLRLWLAPVRFRGKPVWIGQVSRDIGVRFTHRTWNLMTHRIDPEVDEARDYVIEDLMHRGRVEAAAYFDGVSPCDAAHPRRNLTGDPYYTDGQRAAVLLSDARTTPRFVSLF